MREINLKITVDSCFYRIGESEFRGIFGLEIINGNSVFIRIDNPVFKNSSCSILEEFSEIVCPSASGRDNFNDPVRSAGTSFIIQLFGVAYYTDIRFDVVFIICV